MRRLQDKAFLAYAGVVVAIIGGLTLVYPPDSHATGLDHDFIRMSLLLLLGIVVVVRFGGSLVGFLGAMLVVLVGVLSAVWLAGITRIDPDTLVDLLALALVGGGIGLYVELLSRRAEQAARGEERHAHVLGMSVDLVPRALDSQALERLLESVESAAGASRVALLIKEDGLVCDASEDASGREPVDAATRSVARLMMESFPDAARDGRPGDTSAAAVPQPLVTSRRDVFIPVISSHGVEGTLYARRDDKLKRWHDREVDFLAFAANLVGALIEREHLHEQAMRAEAMEEADRLKGNILLSVSHDLKTPIAAAMATLSSVIDTLAERREEPLQENLLSVRDDLLALDTRVTELIDIARLETADWKPHVEYNDVSDLCHMVRMTVSERQRSRLVLCGASEVPPFEFDLVQIGRALNHLVQNALFYSPEDSPVIIDVSHTDTEYRIAVEDEGPGVTDGDAEHIFEKFYRGSASRSVPHGSGLGLSIAEKIIAGHGGRIEVENREPHGSRFTVVLPRSREGMQ